MNELNFRKACSAYDIPDCEALLNSLNAQELVNSHTILEENVRLSGCLINRRPITADVEIKRNAFIYFCRTYVQNHPDTLVRLDEHIKHANVLEFGYRAILAAVNAPTIGQKTPDSQVWSAIGRAVKEIELLCSKIRTSLKARKSIFDPGGGKIKLDTGDNISPDGAIEVVVNVLGMTLMMYAWENGWINNRNLVIPNRVDVGEDLLLEAGRTQLLGYIWSEFELCDKHLRYFGEEITFSQAVVVNEKEKDFVEFQLKSTALQLIDSIARERLQRRLIKVHREVDASAIKQDFSPSAPLPPEGFISADEASACIALSEVFIVPIKSDRPIYKELALKHWLRGYAALKSKLAYKNDEPVLEMKSFNKDEITTVLVHSGLTEKQGHTFLEATIFKAGAGDLFNTPFVLGNDGSLYFFAPAYTGANLSQILISMLSVNKVQFEKKGTDFESHVRRVLTTLGHNAIGFKYQSGNEEFECDAVFIWEKKLFIFECKNYGLPSVDPISSYHFAQKMDDASKQVQRNKSHFTTDPQLVKKQLGEDVTWTEIIPCVLNSMPWAPGKLGETYFYDYSSLGKFFEEGNISIHSKEKRLEIPLWSSVDPSADDLIREMTKPSQTTLLEEEWEFTNPVLPLSSSMVFNSPRWNRRVPDPARSLKAFGLDEQEIKSFLSGGN